MTNEEFLDEPVRVVAAMDGEGKLDPQRVTWQRRKYRITAVGRQWDEADGRHVLIEAADGTRFELQLRREDFAWRVKRVWRTFAAA
ncbi:MAG: hypothetical protein HS126_07070 [Anaerolineales bacterium]|nr:hypothetical protein [Anaerolineales bacterium]